MCLTDCPEVCLLVEDTLLDSDSKRTFQHQTTVTACFVFATTNAAILDTYLLLAYIYQKTSSTH